MSIVYPTLLTTLSPTADDQDVVDADIYTNLDSAVTVYADGTYSLPDDTGSLPQQFFWVRLFDDSTGDWHVQSPFRVYLGGTVRMPVISGTADAVKQQLQALGLSVIFDYDRSDTVAEGDVISANYATNDVISVAQVVTLLISSEAPSQYAEQFARLLPRGALATDPNSWLRKLWLGVTAEFQRIYQRARLLRREAHPSTTDELLSDWETEYGLPDPCVTEAQSIDDRKAGVMARHTSVGGNSLPYFKRLAASMGVTIDIVEEKPFEVGRDGCGMGIGGNEWSFTWSVYAPLQTPAARRQLLECVFDRVKPAHTVVQFYYE